MVAPLTVAAPPPRPPVLVVGRIGATHTCDGKVRVYCPWRTCSGVPVSVHTLVLEHVAQRTCSTPIAVGLLPLPLGVVRGGCESPTVKSAPLLPTGSLNSEFFRGAAGKLLLPHSPWFTPRFRVGTSIKSTVLLGGFQLENGTSCLHGIRIRAYTCTRTQICMHMHAIAMHAHTVYVLNN